MEKLHRYIYTSTMSDEDGGLARIPQILRTADRNNLHLGITSLLIFDGLHFCQYLEGKQSNIEPLLQRIVADTRHDTVTIRAHGPLDGARRFPKWRIAFALALTSDALECFNKLNDQSAFDTLDALLPSLDLGHMAEK